MSYSQYLNIGEEEDDKEEECGQSSGTSVCGYDGDYDNDNETVCEDFECDLGKLIFNNNIRDRNNSENLKLCFGDTTQHNIKEWIFVGSTVLSRWTDGLYYLGLILKVFTFLSIIIYISFVFNFNIIHILFTFYLKIDSIGEKCLVQFEDSSIYWIRFEDLHKQLSVGSVMADSDILCSICRDGTSQTPNEM
jgi:hypothetical protein